MTTPSMRDARPSFARARRRRSASRHPVPSRSPPSSTRAALGFSRTNEQRKRGERKRFAFVPRTPRAQTSPRGIPHTSRASVVMILARPRLALFALPVSPPSRRRRVAVAPPLPRKKRNSNPPTSATRKTPSPWSSRRGRRRRSTGSKTLKMTALCWTWTPGRSRGPCEERTRSP